MHGSSFKDKGELDRMITVKTTKTFSQCPEWLIGRESIATDNEKYYEMIEKFRHRIIELLWEMPSERAPIIREFISDLNGKEILHRIGRLVPERINALIEIFKSKPTLLEEHAKTLGVNKSKRDWQKEVAENLAQDHEKSHEPSILKELRKRMETNYRQKVITAMLLEPEFGQNPDYLERGLVKYTEKFRSWIFLGLEGSIDGTDERTPDPIPGETHRLKLKPFLPGQVKGEAIRKELSFSKTTPCEVHPLAVKRSGLDEKSIFRLEQSARGKGYSITRLNFLGNFQTPIKKHTLPDGTTVPWFSDPRVHYLRPGSIAKFVLTAFVYLQPFPGMKLELNPNIYVLKRGPPFSNKTPNYEDDQYAEALDDDNDSEQVNGGEKRKRNDEDEDISTLLPVGTLGPNIETDALEEEEEEED